MDEELSGSDADEGFDEDMEALRRACILTGTDPEALQPSSASASAADTTDGTAVPGGGPVSDSEEDDLELVRGIQQRFSAYTHAEVPLFLKPLSTLPPVASDDDEDDFETLRAIQRRFAGYDKDSLEKGTDNYLNKLEQVHATNIALEKETCNSLVVDRIDVSKGFPDSLDVYNTSQNSESFNDITAGICPSGLIEWHQPDTHDLAIIPPRDSGFPKYAQMFVDAIKKNRACQKFLRSKLIQIEARIEENKKLKQRVKILKDFQVTCKKRTGRALSQKKDARVQLISTTKPRSSSKVNGKKVPALYYGPDENSRVASYRMVLTRFPISLSREKWSDEERENLAKGIRQQFQELLLQKSVDLISDVEGSSGDSNDFDSIIASICDLDITPETIRSFLPKVNWERLASMYITGRSGSECEARWLNCEDPLINHHPWTKLEDKKLLHIVQQRGINNWIDIAVLLGTNRTPFQCLARYQRSLNASILKREWSEDEDDKLRAAIEDFGESNWQVVASTLEGRTGTQCSNRWIKSLHPARQRVGRWTSDEDKRLKVSVMLFGPKTWKKVAQFVPGRTHVQCRERWFNSLDPSLNLGEWTEEEDSRLQVAITEHGYCWSKVAACVPPRTDNQCRRRWKVLLPHEVPLLQAARKIQKAALISNFVDRESERPALGPNDFIPLALTNTVSESENVNPSGKQKRKSRKWSGSKGNGKVSRSKRLAKEAQICTEEVPLLTNGNEVENIRSDDVISKKKRVMEPHSKKKRSSEPTQNVMRNGEEVRLFDWGTKKKKSFGRRKRKFSRSPEAEEIGTVSMDDAISMKERAMKPCSKKNKGSDPTKAQLPACADSELLFVTNGEEVGEIGGDDGAKNKKASKPGRRKSKCVKLIDDISGMIKLDEVVSLGGNDAISENNEKPSLPHLKQDNCTNPTQVHSSSGPDSTSLRISNLNEVKALDDDGARKKNALKLCSRSKYSKLMQELLELTDSSETETLGGDNAILEKERVTKRSLKKCTGQNHSSSSKLLTTTANEVESFGGNDATKKRKASKPCTRNKCTDPPKQTKSPPLLPAGLETSRADDGIETTDGDNSTLRRKKRTRNVHPRRKCSKQSGEHKDFPSSCISVSKLQSKQSETTKLVAGSQSTSLPQKCLTSVLSDNGNPRASGICPQQRLKRSRTRERTCSNDIMEAKDGDDMTLACFIKNKTKKRRLKLAEKGNDASYPGNMKGSELLYENCRNDGRNDVLSYQAIQSSHSEDPAGTVAREIDCGDSHMVAEGTSPLHASLKEPLSIDVEGDSEAGDDPSDTLSSPWI